jgi:hypothetical protein
LKTTAVRPSNCVTAAAVVVAIAVQFQSMRQRHITFRGMFMGLQTVGDDTQQGFSLENILQKEIFVAERMNSVHFFFYS